MRSSSTLAILTSRWWLHWDTRGARIPSAACFVLPTAARRGRKFCTRTKTLALSTLCSIRRNSNIVYASLWQVRRQPWTFNSGGPGSGLYKSVDGGLTWKQLQDHGLPDGELGRIGVSVSGADSNRVYALIEAKEGGLFRSG